MLLAGKRLLFVSGYDYGQDMAPLVFSRGQTLCGWNEPPLASIDGVPHCEVAGLGEVQVRAALRCGGACCAVLSVVWCGVLWHGVLCHAVQLSPPRGHLGFKS